MIVCHQLSAGNRADVLFCAQEKSLLVSCHNFSLRSSHGTNLRTTRNGPGAPFRAERKLPSPFSMANASDRDGSQSAADFSWTVSNGRFPNSNRKTFLPLPTPFPILAKGKLFWVDKKENNLLGGSQGVHTFSNFQNAV